MTTSPTIAALIEAGARQADPELWAMIDKYAADDDWNGATALNARHNSLRRFQRGLAAFLDQLMAMGPSEGMLAAGDSMMPQIAKGQDITTGRDALADAWPAMLAELRREIADG